MFNRQLSGRKEIRRLYLPHAVFSCFTFCDYQGMTRIYSHLVHGHARDFYRFIFCQSQYSPQPAVMQGQTLGSLIAFDTYLPTYLGYIMIVSVCRLGRTFASCRERSLTSFDWIGLSCFAYIEFDRDLQVWSNPNRRSAVR